MASISRHMGSELIHPCRLCRRLHVSNLRVFCGQAWVGWWRWFVFLAAPGRHFWNRRCVKLSLSVHQPFFSVYRVFSKQKNLCSPVFTIKIVCSPMFTNFFFHTKIVEEKVSFEASYHIYISSNCYFYVHQTFHLCSPKTFVFTNFFVVSPSGCLGDPQLDIFGYGKWSPCCDPAEF